MAGRQEYKYRVAKRKRGSQSFTQTKVEKLKEGIDREEARE